MTASADSSTRRTENAVLISAILASSMAFIDSSALDVASLSLQRDLRISGSQLLWIINAYTLMLSALILLGGALGDHYGRKRIFTMGIMVFTAASVFCGLSSSAPMLIAARAAQGVGGALMVPGSLSLISAAFPSDRRGKAIGIWSTFSTLTTLFGPALGGWLAEHGLWRMVFFINVPLASIAIAILILRVPEMRARTTSQPLDYLGALLITVALGALTYTIIEAPGLGWDSPMILGAFALSLITAIGFIIVEARSSHPMMPLRLFKSRTFSGTNALTLFLYGALGAAPFFLLLNLQQVQNYRQEITGLTFIPLGILLTIMSPWAGGLIDRIGARIPLIIGPAVAGLGFFIMGIPAITSGEQDYWLTYFPAVIVLGIGLGITVAPLTTAVMGAVSQDSVGIASGINNAAARSARVLAIAIFGAIALSTFSGSLAARAENLGLPDDIQDELRDEAARLAAARSPFLSTAYLLRGVDLSVNLIYLVPFSIKAAFVDTFQLISFIAAGMAWLSAVLAAITIEGKPRAPRE